MRSDAGKKGGEFFTPSQVSELVASRFETERERPHICPCLRERRLASQSL
ncbi:MAG: N-6 DNA methylase [Eubacteriales bacterium]